MNDLPLVSRDYPMSPAVSSIPLDFVQPGLSLAQIGSILWAYRKSSLLIVLLVVSLTVLAMALWPRTYTASAALMVNYEINDPVNGKELPVGQVGSYIATQIELMQTPEVLLTVVDRLGLTEVADYARGHTADSGTLREWAGNKMSKSLVVSQSPGGGQIIYVTYSASNPKEAAQVANSIADVYKEQDTLRSAGPPDERIRRYTQQLKELAAKVDQAQKQVTSFHRRNGLLDEGGKTNVDVTLLGTLEGRLVEAQNARRAAQARASEDQAVSNQVLASNHTQVLKLQLAAQELRLVQLNRVYLPAYPDVIETQLQIETTRQALKSALKTYSDNAAATLNVEQTIEQSMQRAVGGQRAKVLAKGQLQDEAAKYALELASAQDIYKRALEGYDQVMFATNARSTNVGLVSRAAPPVRAAKPRVLTGLALGAIAALLLGLGLPLGYELLNRRVRCRDDVQRQYGIPVLVEFGRLPMRAAA